MSTIIALEPALAPVAPQPIDDAAAIPAAQGPVAAEPARAPDAVIDRGLSTTKLPELLADWRVATVEASIYEAAYASFEPEVLAAIDAKEQLLGRKLRRAERAAIERAIAASRLPTLEPALRQQLAADDATRERTIADAVARHQPIVAAYRDPFTPVIKRLPGARAAERVLWENAGVLVIVDRFAAEPHVLVIPKAKAMLPTDLLPATLDELARVAAAAADAMAQAAASNKPVAIWINPPQDLHVRQLHVHVVPDLPPWQVLEPLAGEQRRLELHFYGEVERRLAQRLGPTS